MLAFSTVAIHSLIYITVYEISLISVQLDQCDDGLIYPSMQASWFTPYTQYSVLNFTLSFGQQQVVQ